MYIDTLALVVVAGLVQGLNIVSMGFLFTLVSLEILTQHSRREVLVSGLVYTVLYFITTLVVVVLFFRALVYIPGLTVSYIARVFSVLLVGLGLSMMIVYTGGRRPLARALRGLLRNPLIVFSRRLLGRGVLFSSAATGLLAGLANLSCPCTLPLIPAVASYIVSIEVQKSLYMAVLYSFSATLPTVAVLVSLLYRGVFEKIHEAVVLKPEGAGLVVSTVLVVLGLAMLFSV